jgi:hypothetical protein
MDSLPDLCCPGDPNYDWPPPSSVSVSSPLQPSGGGDGYYDGDYTVVTKTVPRTIIDLPFPAASAQPPQAAAEVALLDAGQDTTLLNDSIPLIPASTVPDEEILPQGNGPGGTRPAISFEPSQRPPNGG